MDSNSRLIVMVEDEPVLRALMTEFLEDDGFDVIGADNADEGLDLLTRNASAIRVLFTDVDMPGAMDGMALAHHTRRHWPWIELLIVSGGFKPDVLPHPVNSRFLRKPYSPLIVSDYLATLMVAAAAR